MSGTVSLQHGGDASELAVNHAYRTSGKWWRMDRAGAHILAESEQPWNGATCAVVTILSEGGKAFEAWFDIGTRLLVKTVEKHGLQNATTVISDYRWVDGVLLPHNIIVDMGHGEKYRRLTIVTKAEFLGSLADSVYEPPKVVLADFSIVGNAEQTDVPFRLINNHIFVEVRINGAGPFSFLFDTGGVNVITPTLANTLGLELHGTIPEFGIGEGVMEGSFAHVAEIQVGDAVIKDQVFTVLPLENVAHVEGAPMPGLVGYEVFRRFVTRINYETETITLIDSRGFTAKESGTPVRFEFRDHILEVSGTFEGLPTKYNVDTGLSSEITLTRSFVEKHGLREKHPEGVEAVNAWGVGGSTRAYVTRGSSVTIGSISVGNVITSMMNEDTGALLNSIGGRILKRFIVTFDYEHQTMYLKPRADPVRDTGAFDRAGMWINGSESGFEIVDVIKDSPAEQAGLKPCDTILAVNGEPASKVRLYDLREYLRNGSPGSTLTLRVKKARAVEDVKITLRNLI